MASGLRFDPPVVELSTALSWVLVRAFGPVDSAVVSEEPLRVERALNLADALDLIPRIGSRISLDRLELEMGVDGARLIREAHTSCVARSLVVEQVCREVGGLGADLGIPIIFLKGAALQLAGSTPAGSRDMCDVDVLVPGADARPFQEALIDAGCRVTEAPEAEHQLQFLTHRTGLGIEVHRLIPGLRLRGETFVDAETMVGGGLVERAPGLPGEGLIPNRNVLLAHLMVHGIAQHGLAPDAYPFSRLLGDVQDLGLSRSEFGAFMDSGFGWIEQDLTRSEVEAVDGLARAMAVGKDPLEIAHSEESEGAILRHLIAGATDEAYVLSMRMARRSHALTEGPRWRRNLRDGYRSLWLTRGQVDVLYGKPKSTLGYWGWRLLRPFDLVGRAARYGKAWAGHKFRARN